MKAILILLAVVVVAGGCVKVCGKYMSPVSSLASPSALPAIAAASPVVDASQAVSSDIVRAYGLDDNGKQWCYVAGVLYRLGGRYSQGVCVQANADGVAFLKGKTVKWGVK